MLALSETMAELNAGISTLPDRLTLEPAPATTAQESSDPSPSALNLSAPLFPASPAYDASSSSGPFNTAAELNKEGSNDLISQLPSLEGSQSSLSEEKSLLLNEDMQRSREADENDLRPLEGVKQFWQIMGADSRSQAGMGVITGIANDMASSALRDWMGQSGNTRIQFNSAGEASADLLLPWWDTPSTLLFNQQGVRVNKERTTLNLGLGLRHYLSDHFMLGVNSFYDRDITGNNARFSVGAEAWTHYLKLSANKYQRLTDWHQSPLDAMEDYDERPANGFDLAADAWLPFYPQFGGSVKYEKYFGKGIILDNSASPSDLRDSPSAVTTTVNYTPIPLLTFKAGHKSGSGSDSFVGLDINYRLGVSWSEQTDKETVRVMRSLPGARYDFVDRNYNIVMQYRKQNLISLSLPASVSAEAASTMVITASVRAKYGLKKIDWRAAELIAAGGSLSQDSATSVAVKLPKYLHEGVNSYTVSAIATDNHGNVSPESTVVINLIPSSTIITLDVNPAANVVANGVDAAQLHAKVTGKSGELLSDHNVRFVVSGIDDSCILKGANNCEALHITDTSGSAMVPLASTRAGKVTIFSHLDNGNRDSKTLNFIADSTTAEMADLTIDVNNAVANGNVANKARVLVADYYGNPIGNVPVTFSVAGEATPSTTSTVTDNNGSATVELTSKLAGTVTLTASATGMTKSAELTFVADLRTAKIDDLFATPATEVTANGADATVLTAVVKDINGNRVSGAPVIFNATGGAKLGQTTVISDADGAVRVNLTSTRAGSSTVTATTGEDKTGKQVTVTFISDISTAQIGQFTASPEAGLKADGTEAAQLNAVVQDAQGNAVSGILVNFAIVSGNGRLSTAEAISGNDGTVAVSLTSATANSITVSATTPFDATGKQVSVEFVADVATASVESLIASPATEVKANGIATSILSAQVKDARGNLVRGAKVSFNVPADGNSKLSQPSAITSSEGIATVQLTSTLADIITVTAKTDFDTTGKQTSVSFIADATTAKVASLNASRETEVKADGSDSSLLTAQVKDNFGNAVAGVTVTFRVQGNAILGESTAETTSDGTATVSLTSKAAGSSTVTAVLDGDSIGKQAIVSFIGDAATAKVESLIPSRDNDVLSNGNDMSILTVTIKDANGNLVNNAKVSFNVSGKGSVTPSPVTTSNGIATVQLTSTEAGIVTVLATTDTDATGKQTSVTFMADVGTAKIDSLHASRDSDVKANGTDSSELTVTVKDANGNLVDGAKVFFSATGKGQLSPNPATTVNGVATTVLTSLGAESISVTATTNVDSTGKTESVSFIADSDTATIADFIASPANDVTANSADSATLTATVKDAQGNPINGTQVYFSVSDGSKGKLSWKSATTSQNGIATVQLINTVAEVSTVTAVTDLDQAGKQTTVGFTADLATAKVDDLTATRTEEVSANGTDSTTLVATVKDSNGNLVNGAKVTFSVVTGEGELSQKSANTVNGIASVSLVSTRAETKTVKAVTEFDPTGKQASVSFVADLATAQIVEASTRENFALANGQDNAGIFVIVEDAYGNSVKNATVYFSVDGTAKLSYSSAPTLDYGITVVYLTSLIAATSTVTVTTAYDQTGKNSSVTFIADSTTAKVDSLTPFPSTALANGSSVITLTAVVTDANNNPVSQVPVSFTATDGAILKSNSATTDSDGKVSVELTSVNAGGSTVTATTDTDQSGQKATVTFVAEAETASIASFTATPSSAVQADGKAMSTLTATVKDANGNGVNNELVSFNITGSAQLSASSSRTDSSGNATVTLTSTAADSNTITAVTAYDTSGKQISVSFIADVTTANIDSLTASRADNVTADGSDSSVITARVKDANGNLVSGAKVTFSVTDNGILSQNIATTVEGIATVQLTSLTAESITVTATTSADPTGKQTSVSFVGDPTTAIVDTLTASPASGVVANGIDYSVLTATVKDINGNLVSGAKVWFERTPGYSDLSQASVISVDGLASVQLTDRIAETIEAIAYTDADPVGKEVYVSFIADSTTVKIDTLTASRDSDVTADGSDHSEISATVKDANGNPLSGVAVSFAVTSGEGVLAETTISNVKGVATANLTSRSASSSTVTATLEGDNIGQQVSVSFVADAATAHVDFLDASRKSDVIANGADSSVLRARVLDANNNAVSNKPVSFTISGNANLTGTSATTDSEGYAEMKLTSLIADSSTVTATTDYDKTGKQASVSFIADQATAKVDSLSAAPESGITANGTDKSVLTATVSDANGNRVNNARVTFTIEGNASLSNSSATTDSDGKAMAIATSWLTGSNTVLAQTAYDETGKEASVSFIGDAATAAIDSFTASTSEVVADGKSFATLTGIVKDANGNLVEGAAVTFKAPATGTLSQSSAVSDSEGKVVITIASEIAGIHETKASTKYGPEGKNAAVSFIADKKTAKVTDIMMSANTPLANGKDQSVLTAVVQDANDNPVSDVDVTFTLNGKATPNQLTARTDSSGYATITLTSTVAGSNTVTANTESVKDSKSITVEFDADASTATIASLTATPAEGVLADGIAVSTITALITDAYDNPVTDAVVTFSAPGTLSEGQVQTDSAGLAITTVSSTQAMTMEVMASTNGVDKTVDVTFIADSQTAFVDSLTASPETGVLADNLAFSTLTVVVKDARGNPVKDVVITYITNQSDKFRFASMKPTDANGIATANVYSSLAGTKTIIANIHSDTTGKSTKVTFVAGPIKASNSTLEVSNSSIMPADGISTMTLTLTAYDQFANKATGAKVAFKVANVDGAKISAVTEEDGVYTATLTSGTTAATGTITVLENDTLLEGLSAEVGQYSSQVTLVIN
ncbi:Ig-like domain-containing protein [Erwinia billingiae]|uniref:Ig-like domain-containing protein n=1 Tax=Erwinia billingiae TaxID=182337 RepID=UPI001364B4E2|nr:Ig-like domain-containing protein [Erwinia billingiae]